MVNKLLSLSTVDERRHISTDQEEQNNKLIPLIPTLTDLIQIKLEKILQVQRRKKWIAEESYQRFPLPLA